MFLWLRRTQRQAELQLFPQYLRSIIEHWNSIAWGPSILAFLFFSLWLSIGSPPLALTIAAFAIVFILAGYYAWRAEHIRLIPKLTFSEEILVVENQTNGEWAKWLQLLPQCLTDVPVEGCQGYLLQVRVLKAGRWEATPLSEPLKLTWSNHDDRPLVLRPGIPQRLNVLWVTNKRGIVPAIAGPQEARWRLPISADTFRFDIVLATKEFPSINVSVEVSITSIQTDRSPAVKAALVNLG
jgi:hypothetical protein